MSVFWLLQLPGSNELGRNDLLQLCQLLEAMVAVRYLISIALLPNLILPVDDPFSDKGVSTVTLDVSGSESGNHKCLSDASGLEDISETPCALKRTLLQHGTDSYIMHT